jgi:hypothetical protein
MNSQPNDTGRQMLASGQWSKSGHEYVHVSGATLSLSGNGDWLIGGYRYSTLWAARSAVEDGKHKFTGPTFDHGDLPPEKWDANWPPIQF